MTCKILVLICHIVTLKVDNSSHYARKSANYAHSGQINKIDKPNCLKCVTKYLQNYIKCLGSAENLRVGRVTGNRHLFFKWKLSKAAENVIFRVNR